MNSTGDIVILAIESSCDDTGAAICINGEIRSNCISSQSIHSSYGGVVPELASRAHIENIVAVTEQAIAKAEIIKKDINAVAFTRAPGLLGSLLVGAGFARSFAAALNVPCTGVHHMEAHVLSNLIEKPGLQLPFLCLTVSGGHTQLVICNSPTSFEVIGETMDDAAGEAFDKIGKLLGLPYPAGPAIDKLARQSLPVHRFAEPAVPGLNFSFSGLKTSVLYYLQAEQKNNPAFITENLASLCASAQYAIINILMKKLVAAAKQTGISSICLAGGVSANSGLRQALVSASEKYGWDIHYPSPQYCTDNAAMIAQTAWLQFKDNRFQNPNLEVSARSGF